MGKKKLFNLLLSADEGRLLAARAKRAGVSKSELVRRLIIAPADRPDHWIHALALVQKKFLADAELLAFLPGLSRQPNVKNLGRSDLETILGMIEDNKSTLAVAAAVRSELRRVAEVVLGLPRNAWGK